VDVNEDKEKLRFFKGKTKKIGKYKSKSINKIFDMCQFRRKNASFAAIIERHVEKW